jgi:hypothetical protein
LAALPTARSVTAPVPEPVALAMAVVPDVPVPDIPAGPAGSDVPVVPDMSAVPVVPLVPDTPAVPRVPVPPVVPGSETPVWAGSVVPDVPVVDADSEPEVIPDPPEVALPSSLDITDRRVMVCDVGSVATISPMSL